MKEDVTLNITGLSSTNTKLMVVILELLKSEENFERLERVGDVFYKKAGAAELLSQL